MLKLGFGGADENGRLAIYSKGSPAALFRGLSDRGIVCLDDIESLYTDRPTDLRRGLLVSYKQSSGAQYLIERGRPKYFSIFGMKLFTSISPVEPILGSRCIIVRMRKAYAPTKTMDAERASAFREKMMMHAMSFVPNFPPLTGGGREEEIRQGLRYFTALAGVQDIVWGATGSETPEKVLSDVISGLRMTGRALVSALEIQLRLRARGAEFSLTQIGKAVAEHRLMVIQDVLKLGELSRQFIDSEAQVTKISMDFTRSLDGENG